MRGEIICIGDELLSGRVRDRNSSYLASRLWPLGIEISAVSLVGDDPESIKETLKRALSRADFVVVSGGLGTTEDDITAAMAAEVFELPLAQSRRMVAHLRAFMARRGREVTDELLKMAWLPEGAEILDGTCAGFRLSGPGGKPVYFLPGVPEEMRRLTDQRVVPELLQRLGGAQAVTSREVRIFGLPESEVGRRLAGLSGGGARLGFYPVFPEVQVLITVRAPSREQARSRARELEREVCSRLGDHVVATGGDTLEQVVARGLEAQGLSLALAESCTGGLIGHRITSVPGSSRFFERGLVVYSNRAKEELLGVRPETLAGFGAVSAQTAAEMAQGARRAAGTDLGLSVTGIAGPGGGTAEKPVGTVYFGLAGSGRVRTGGYRFHGSRFMIKALAAEQALDWLRRFLEDHAFIRGS